MRRLFCALLLCGCADRSRAEHTLTLLDRMIAAEGEPRAALLAELERLELDGDAAEARDRCVAAYRALGSAQAALSARTVAPAEAELARAEELMPGCQQAVSQLRKQLRP